MLLKLFGPKSLFASMLAINLNSQAAHAPTNKSDIKPAIKLGCNTGLDPRVLYLVEARQAQVRQAQEKDALLESLKAQKKEPVVLVQRRPACPKHERDRLTLDLRLVGSFSESPVGTPVSLARSLTARELEDIMSRTSLHFTEHCLSVLSPVLEKDTDDLLILQGRALAGVRDLARARYGIGYKKKHTFARLRGKPTDCGGSLENL